jgi:hypothetical protein
MHSVTARTFVGAIKKQNPPIWRVNLEQRKSLPLRELDVDRRASPLIHGVRLGIDLVRAV